MATKRNATELGTQPIGKLLTQYAIPAIIAMTASSLYNMVDSIFIGQPSHEAKARKILNRVAAMAEASKPRHE